MELHSIPEAFQTKLRIAIISALITGEKSFKEIKQLTNATDGNISVQISKLEGMGYLESNKEFIMKKPRTTYKITEKGSADFREYVEMLGSFLEVDK